MSGGEVWQAEPAVCNFSMLHCLPEGTAGFFPDRKRSSSRRGRPLHWIIQAVREWRGISVWRDQRPANCGQTAGGKRLRSRRRLKCPGAAECVASSAAAAFEPIGLVPRGRVPTLSITSGTGAVPVATVSMATLDNITVPCGRPRLLMPALFSAETLAGTRSAQRPWSRRRVSGTDQAMSPCRLRGALPDTVQPVCRTWS